MAAGDDLDRVEVTSVAQLRGWLAGNHAQDESVWLVTWKKSSSDPSRYVGRWDVLDELLSVGWIDGRRKVLDDDRTMQLVGPRRHDRWSATYRERVERLLDEGRVLPAGLAAVERARAAGTWEALPEVDALEVPGDLADALASTGARAAWEGLPPSYRRNVLRWIATARRDATRADRVARAASATAAGQRLPQL